MLGKRTTKELEELKNGLTYNITEDEESDKEFDVGKACCDKDDMLGRVHPNKK